MMLLKHVLYTGKRFKLYFSDGRTCCKHFQRNRFYKVLETMNWYFSTANFFDWLIRLRSKWDWKKMRLKYKLDRVFGNVQLRQVVLAKYGWMTPFRLDSWINQNRLKHTDGVNKLRWMLPSKSHSFQGRHFIEPHFYL